MSLLLQARTPATAGLVVFVKVYLLQARSHSTLSPLQASAPARKKWDNLFFRQGLFVAGGEPMNPLALAGVRACKEKMG